MIPLNKESKLSSLKTEKKTIEKMVSFLKMFLIS